MTARDTVTVPATRGRRDAPVVAIAFIPIVLFALTPVSTRIIVGELDPLVAGLVRTAGAIIVTLPLALVLRFALPRDAGGWWLLALNACTTFTAFPVLFCLGGQYTSASHASLIMATTPIITGLCVAALERSRPRPAWWLGSAMAFSGEAALVLLRAPGDTSGTLAGDLLILGACLGAGIGYIAGARLIDRIGAWPATFWSITFASILQIPFVALLWHRADWRMVDLAGWLSLFHLTYGVTVIALMVWLWALARGGIARVAVLQFIQPVLGVAFAALLLHEPLTLPLLVAGAAILAGVVIARHR
jgi:drug/metabolite transporter (DMT)-like permease